MKGVGRSLICVWAFFFAAALQAATFTTNSFVRTDIALGGSPIDVAAARGLAAVAYSTGAVVLNINLGATPSSVETPLLLPANFTNTIGSIAVGQFDGRSGAVVGMNQGALVYTNFASPPLMLNFGASSLSKKTVVVDLDGDGKADIATMTDALYVLRNESANGNLAFAAPVRIAVTDPDFQLADFNGDGRLDVLTTNSYPLRSRFEIRLNTSTGGILSFAEPVTNSITGAFSSAPYMIAADYNHDGRSDVVSLFPPTDLKLFPILDPSYDPKGSISFSKNTTAAGPVAFAPAITALADLPSAAGTGSKFRIGLRSVLSRTVCADLDNDGRLDFAIAGWETNLLTIVPNASVSADYSPTAFEPILDLPAKTLTGPLRAVDIDGDGELDLIAGNYPDASLSIFRNQIVPVPEFHVTIDGARKVTVGDAVHLRGLAYHADVTAAEFFEDGRSIGSSDASLELEYHPTSAGLHYYTARAASGADAGLSATATGLRVLPSEAALGKVVSLGGGPFSSATFLIYENGEAYGVGNNSRGQLGDEFLQTSRPAFSKLSPPPDGAWREITGGNNFEVALSATGRLFTWGDNSQGQLGRPTPTVINSALGEVAWHGGAIRKIRAGANFTMVIDADGALYGWGVNNYGQMGFGTTNEIVITPRRVLKPNSIRWKEVAPSISQCLALSEDGQLFACGIVGGDFSQVTQFTLIPLPAGETAWTNVAGTSMFSMAQTASGHTYVFGNNYYDALGLGPLPEDAPDFFPTPTLQPGPAGFPGFQKLAPGFQIHGGIGNDGALYVWGGDSLAAVGLSDTNHASMPTRLDLPGVNRWLDVKMGAQRGLALADNGRAYGWGFNLNGALGIGSSAVGTPRELCSPVSNCSSNYPPYVRIAHPIAGDSHPLDGKLTIEVSAIDFDGVVDRISILKTISDFSGSRDIEIGRLGAGETNFVLSPIPPSPIMLKAVAYDETGRSTTSSSTFITVRSTNTWQSLALSKLNTTNEFTGWQEVTTTFGNAYTFRMESLLVLITNVPDGVIIRNSIPYGPSLVGIPYNFAVTNSETARFRLEFKSPEDFTNATVRINFLPIARTQFAFTGEPQAFSSMLLTNGQMAFEIPSTPGKTNYLQFSGDLTNWITIPLPNDSPRWSDGGPPYTPKHPQLVPQRFYRVLHSP